MSKKKSGEFQQIYNEEWEKLPIFRGWLSSVKNNKFKALCKYCKKEFRAHRTDLRTHAQSRKHQKSADAYYEYDNEENHINVKQNLSSKVTKRSSSEDLQITSSKSGKTDEIKEDWDQLDDDCHSDSDDFDDPLRLNIQRETHPSSRPTIEPTDNVVVPLVESCEIAVLARVPETIGITTRESDANIISTQVQDMARGLPVDRLVVYLFIFKGDQWLKLGKGTTEKDGSCSKFVSVQECDDVIVPGHYKLRFETKMHFTLNLEESLFPFIEVPFDVGDLTVEHKINLLISPYGYMVFRGS